MDLANLNNVLLDCLLLFFVQINTHENVVARHKISISSRRYAFILHHLVILDHQRKCTDLYRSSILEPQKNLQQKTEGSLVSSVPMHLKNVRGQQVPSTQDCSAASTLWC